ncbi:helix-turn-helix domain-containing protein [Dactylosporangium sp. NPDC051485]|uniref:helix-turn-helix domain-containing protein n=1 Tax=Dactylosporangium sp. NPDC051485 TaxID=3154846 RepID=UPI00343DFB3B
MTGPWRPLDGTLAPEVAHLVGELRRMKDRSRLSLTALAGRTAYSKSSWERYLNGRALPPRHAIEALARLVDEPSARLVALWEHAEERWSRRAEDAPTGPAVVAVEPDPPPAAEATGAWPVRRLAAAVSWRRMAIAAVVGVAAVAGTVALIRSLGEGRPESSAPFAVTVGCRGAQCDGADADAMACDIDAVSYAALRAGDAYVELRISDRCGAAWARVSHSTVGDEVLVLDQNGHSQAATVRDAASTGRYLPTLMVPADRHSRVRACLQQPGGRRQCTPWGAERPVPPPPPASRAAPST